MRYIFWDFDGTLVQSSPLWRRAMLLALDEYRPGHQVTLEVLAPLVSKGFPWHHAHDHGMTTSEAWWAHMEAKFEDDYRQLGFDSNCSKICAREIRKHILNPKSYNIFPEVKAVLNRLTHRGWRHAILSNNHPDLKYVIESLGLSKFFDLIVTSGAVGFEKPRAEIFHHALQISNANKSDCWMVGDNVIADVAGAESIGLRAILVRSDKSAKFIAKDLLGVETLIEADR